MNKKIIRIFMSVLLVLVVVAAAAFSFASCGANEAKDQNVATDDTAVNAADDVDDSASGGKVITVDVVDADGNVTTFTITTDAEFLREALEQEQLIEGEEGPYGLYVKYVNGIRADYDADGAYWALSKDGEALMSGVDTTPIEDGDNFELTYSK